MGGNPKDLNVAWAIAEFDDDSEGIELIEYPCSIDFSKVNHYGVGEVDGKPVTFGEHMKNFYFFDKTQSFRDVYDWIEDISVEDGEHIEIMKESGIYNKGDLERRCELNDATLKVLELMRNEFAVWS